MAVLLAAVAASPPGLHFVPASPSLLAQCRATARVVGYAVPCPTRAPAGIVRGAGAVEATGCGIGLVEPGGLGGCSRAWRGWVIGSGSAGDQHLVVTASPHALSSYAHLVNGPAWYPAARVRLLGWVSINGWHMRSVFVPAATNDGSSFTNHLALIWTTGGHTYGIAFYNRDGIAATLHLDEALARAIVLTRP